MSTTQSSSSAVGTSAVQTPVHFAVEVNAAPSRDPRSLLVVGALWFAVVLLGFVLVVTGMGPLFHQRAQRVLQARVRANIDVAANEATGLAGVSVAKHPPTTGAPLGMLEIGALRLQQAVVEGVGPLQTRSAPGHVPGTAGLGQAGNAVVVARHATFGGSFRRLGSLRVGTPIVVSTTQGQSLYKVVSVRSTRVSDALFGASKDDRLTLVTSASWSPTNSSRAIVVVAKMDGTPFQRTPQGTLDPAERGNRGEAGAIASVLVASVLYGATLVGAVVFYRRLRSRTAYVLTIAPVLATTVIFAETASRLLPAWS